MKLVFDKADLVKSVGIAMKAVSGKTTMPIWNSELRPLSQV